MYVYIYIYIYIIHCKTIYIQRQENKTKLLRVELSHGVSSVTGYYLHLKSGMQQCSVSNLDFQKNLVSYATLISIYITYFIFDVKCKYEPVSCLTPCKTNPTPPYQNDVNGRQHDIFTVK